MKDLKKDILKVVNATGVSAELFFILEINGNPFIKRVNLEKSAQKDLVNQFVSSVDEIVISNNELKLLPLSKADGRKDVLYKYDLDEIPEELSYLEEILNSDDFENYDFDKDSLDDLKGMIILVGNQDYQMTLYKHQYPVSLLKKGGTFNIKRFKNENRFEHIKEDILRINSSFEFFCINGEYYILDLKTLERFFGFHEAIKAEATKGIKAIAATNIIEDVKVLSARLEDISFARKLAQASKTSPVIGKIPNKSILRFMNFHPALKGKFKFTADGKQVNLKTKRAQNLFMKLLNDDFLHSQLTELHYESLAKDEVV